MLIRLLEHGRCIHADGCLEYATDLHKTLASGRYDFPASILKIDDVDAYVGSIRTARKRAARCARSGYKLEPIDRSQHEEDIFLINTSAPERQGRPMDPGYLTRQTFAPLPAYPCVRHRADTWGVFARKRLVAYLVLRTSGDLLMISQILGHADYLVDDIMYLLTVRSLIAMVEAAGPATCFYNMHDSGTEGLQYFKERLGFKPTRVKWTL